MYDTYEYRTQVVSTLRGASLAYIMSIKGTVLLRIRGRLQASGGRPCVPSEEKAGNLGPQTGYYSEGWTHVEQYYSCMTPVLRTKRAKEL